MPILAVLSAVIGGVLIWYFRNRGPIGTVEDVVEIAQGVRNAPRRIKFKRSANRHPVEQVERVDELVTTIALAYLEQSGLPSREEQQTLSSALARVFQYDLNDADELMTYGRWLMNECGSADQAITRAGRRLYKLDGSTSFPLLMDIIQDVASVSGKVSDAQSRALEQLRKDFRIH